MEQVLPLIKYPTTAVFVDDSSIFIKELRNQLSSLHHCIFYTNPVLAQDDILKKDIKDEDIFQLNEPKNHNEVQIVFAIEKIKQEINNIKKHQKISTLVIDYDMPGIDGLSLCESLGLPHVYKILLTGIAEDKTVISAFHKGIINAYIPKTSIKAQCEGSLHQGPQC